MTKKEPKEKTKTKDNNNIAHAHIILLLKLCFLFTAYNFGVTYKNSAISQTKMISLSDF